MYKTNNITSPNPDSSGASTSLDKNTKKKKKQRLGMQYNVQNKQQYLAKSRFQRRTWKQVQERKTSVVINVNRRQTQRLSPKLYFPS